MTEFRHLFIVDLTQHKLPLSNLINSIRQSVSYRYQSEEVGWLIRPDQSSQFDTDSNIKILLPTRRPDEELTEWIVHLSNEPEGNRVYHVVSNDWGLLSKLEELNGPAFAVATHHFRGIVNGNGNGAGQEKAFSWPSAKATQAAGPRNTFQWPGTYAPRVQDFEPISLTDALELTKRILERDRYTSQRNSLLLAQLRPLMAELNPGAQRKRGDAASENLIKQIATAGVNQGWLGFDPGTPGLGNQRVWLVERREGVASTPPVLHEVAAAGNGSPEKEAKAAVIENRITSSAEKTLLGKVYQEHLVKRRVGSPVRAREFMFAAVKRAISDLDGGSITLSNLMTRVRTSAMQDAADAGYGATLNWEATCECFQNMLLAAEVLEDADGNPIRHRVGSRSSHVVKLNQKFEDRCEAFLVECVIAGHGGVEYSNFHLYNIGLALYQRGQAEATPKDKLIERVDFLLKHLLDEGRIEVNSELLMTTTSAYK